MCVLTHAVPCCVARLSHNRYTECRLSSAAEDMLLDDLEADTVDFAPTFDASQVSECFCVCCAMSEIVLFAACCAMRVVCLYVMLLSLLFLLIPAVASAHT